MDELSFFMSVYDQFSDARMALKSVRKHYPKERIFLFSCGDNEGFEDLTRQFGADGIRTPNLHLAFYGGEIWRRILENYVEHPTKHLVKIDPDTRCHRKIMNGIPLSPNVVWGHLQSCEPEGYFHVQGGCKGTDLAAAKRLLQRKVFEDPLLGDPSTYCGPERLANLKKTGLSCEDRYTQKCYERAGVRLGHCPDIYSLYRGGPPPGHEWQYAFTHPHKIW